jgi:hypothetical protein
MMGWMAPLRHRGAKMSVGEKPPAISSGDYGGVLVGMEVANLPRAATEFRRDPNSRVSVVRDFETGGILI